MKCPICREETSFVFKTNIKRDGRNLWGCSVCRDGKKENLEVKNARDTKENLDS